MKLSIITINLNNVQGLSVTIESVVSQRYIDYEYIVIDGGSTDGSVDVINRYKGEIDYWISENDEGIYHAMNKGIRQAKGEYCLFLNSGDWMIDEESLGRFMQKVGDEDLITSQWQNYIYDGIKPSKGFSFYLFYKVSFMHFNTIIKRSLFEKIGMYDQSYKIVSDWLFFMLAIFKHDCSVKVVEDVIAQNETPGVSLSLMELQKKERMKIMEEYFPYFIDDYKELQRLKQSRFVQFYERIYSNKFLMKLFVLIRKPFV